MIAKEENKNPSELIDKLLEKNHGWLVFQEDTLKFLTNICGMSGSDADNVRRAIGRKQKDRLEAALPKILEGYCKTSNKPKNIAENEAKIFLKIIEDSANYQFGYNHSTGYSMIGYMCGYLRYYYPKEFITAYLNNANNDDDILMGTNLANTLGISMHTIKFRKSSSKYTCDDTGIYKGLGSIKYIGEGLGEELYNIRYTSCSSFVDLLYILKDTIIDSRQLDILIKLDFFSEFGDVNYLLKVVEIYNKLASKKQFNKEALESYGVPLDTLKKYVGKETAKLYKEVDTQGLITELVSSIKVPKLSLLGHIKYEQELLGYPTSIDKNQSKRIFLIMSINSNKAVTRLKLYSIYDGKTHECNIWNKEWEKELGKENDLIFLYGTRKQNKREPTGEINPKTGKKIYRDIPDQFEYWLTGYEIISEEELIHEVD